MALVNYIMGERVTAIPLKPFTRRWMSVGLVVLIDLTDSMGPLQGIEGADGADRKSLGDLQL